MPSLSWPNWPQESPRRPRSPSSFPTSSDSSAFSSPTPSFSSERDGSKKAAVVGKDGGGGASLRLAIPRVRFAWWRRPRQEEVLAARLDEFKQFTLRELQVATDDFSYNNIIGECYISRVYKGKLADGSLVTVKRAAQLTPEQELQFQSEVRMTAFPAHKNLLRLCGFCRTPTGRLLVYPYMANGSVESHLRGRQILKPPLNWPTRKQIALGTARALSYMHDHCNPRIVHRDFHPANIFLNEEFEALLGNFNFINCSDTQKTASFVRTYAHSAPEHVSTGMCTEKTDVFSYGITLLELITGRRYSDLHPREKLLLKSKNIELLFDWDLEFNYNGSEMQSVTQLALHCSRRSPMDRPKMSVVVGMLESGDYNMLLCMFDILISRLLCNKTK